MRVDDDDDDEIFHSPHLIISRCSRFNTLTHQNKCRTLFTRNTWKTFVSMANTSHFLVCMHKKWHVFPNNCVQMKFAFYSQSFTTERTHCRRKNLGQIKTDSKREREREHTWFYINAKYSLLQRNHGTKLKFRKHLRQVNSYQPEPLRTSTTVK